MDIQALISQMTLEEKAGLCSGLDFWHTKPVERLGVPSVMVSDGPGAAPPNRRGRGGGHGVPGELLVRFPGYPVCLSQKSL